MMLYFVLVMLTAFIPIPRRGVTADIAQRMRLPGGSGLWVDQPHRAIAAAALYFLLLGVVELAVMTWVDPRRLLPG